MLIADPSDTLRLSTIRCSSVLQNRIMAIHGRADSHMVATVLSTNRKGSVGDMATRSYLRQVFTRC